jgi:hypothetical protein
VSSTLVSRPENEQSHVDGREPAYAALGLTPLADANLIEIAYWCQVELCHAEGLEQRDWRKRMSALNDARALLVGRTTSHPQPATPPIPHVDLPAPRRTGLAARAAVYVPIVLAAATVASILVLGLSGVASIMVLAGSILLGVILAVGLLRRVPLRQPPVEVSPADALGILALAPTAPLPLISLSYQYLSSRALAEDNLLRKSILDAAVKAALDERGEPDTPDDDAPASSDSPSTPRELDIAQPAISAALDRGGRAPVAADGDRTPPEPDAPGQDGHATREWYATSEPESAAASPRGTRRDPERLYTRGEPPRPAARGDADHRQGTDAGERVAVFLRIAHDGSTQSREVPLVDGRAYAIGSSYSASIRLPTDSVAAEHARLTIRRGRVLFHHIAEDAVSLVNGSETTWAVLEPGDLLELGDYRCRFTSPLGGSDDASAVEQDADRGAAPVSLTT